MASLRSIGLALPLSLLMLCPGNALADEPEEKPRAVAVTMSPIHLLLPVFELTVEPRIINHLSVAAVLGYGKVKVATLFGDSLRFNVYELGGQIRAYPLNKNNEGLLVGAEALYIKVNTQGDVQSVKVSGVGEGLAVGPMIGYKVVARVGFTFDAQLGAQYGVIRAKAEASSGSQSASAKDDDSKIFPLLNLNIGWSF